LTAVSDSPCRTFFLQLATTASAPVGLPFPSQQNSSVILSAKNRLCKGVSLSWSRQRGHAVPANLRSADFCRGHQDVGMLFCIHPCRSLFSFNKALAGEKRPMDPVFGYDDVARERLLPFLVSLMFPSEAEASPPLQVLCVPFLDSMDDPGDYATPVFLDEDPPLEHLMVGFFFPPPVDPQRSPACRRPPFPILACVLHLPPRSAWISIR